MKITNLKHKNGTKLVMGRVMTEAEAIEEVQS